MKTVRMSFGGDFISESEEPLLRAEDGDNYTAVNVFRTEKNKEGALEEKYAYGLFRNRIDLSNTDNTKNFVSINMVTGYTYRFEVTIIVDRDDKVEILNGNYHHPFQLIDSTANGFDKGWDLVNNRVDHFEYTSTTAVNEEIRTVPDNERDYFFQLAYGMTYVLAGNDVSSNKRSVYRNPRVKRYYGNLSSFDPGIASEAEIEMSYRCFGLGFQLANLPSGYLSVTDVTTFNPNAGRDNCLPMVFNSCQLYNEEGKKEWSEIFCMDNLKAESETYTLNFEWHKGDGNSESFTHDVTVIPKKKKILTLNIQGTPNSSAEGNIKFKIENVDEGNLEIETDQVEYDFDKPKS